MFKESIMTDNVVVDVTTREEVNALCDFLESRGQTWEELHREGIVPNCYICPNKDDILSKYSTLEEYKVLSFNEALLEGESVPMNDLIRVEAKEAVGKIDEVFTVDTIPKLPEWLMGLSNKSLRDNPVLVYYSDESEEDAVEDGDIRLLCSVDVGDDSYPFRILDMGVAIDRPDFKYVSELLESEKLKVAIECWNGNITGTTCYNFVVPVRESDWVVEEKSNLTTEEQLASSITKSLMSLEKSEMKSLIELLTKVNDK